MSEAEDIITPVYALAIRGPVLFQIWEQGTPDHAALEAVRLAGVLGRSAHAKTGTLVHIAQAASLPSSAARGTLSNVSARLARSAGVALAREGDGFRFAAIRAVLTGIGMLSRDPAPHAVFETVEQAASWLAARVSGTSAAELVATVGELRARTRG